LADPETIVTVAMNLDPLLLPAYRQRYFACLLESPENPVPVIQYEPFFALPPLFQPAAEAQPPISEFMDGAFRWTLHRLRAYGELLLWPAGHHNGGPAFEGALQYETLPRLEQRLREAAPSLADVGALVLDTENPAHCAVLWEVANWLRNSLTDFYVAEPACAEVYTLHHHEKVQALVPASWARYCAVEELECWDQLLEDCSGYSMEHDDEWDDPEDRKEC
jgi:hypothetical protein